jgi:hypothetical protein
MGLVTIFYCLRFETSLFFASYESQGHGGGIWTRLHMGLLNSIYCTLYIHTIRDYRQQSAITILHTLQFTPAQALGFSVFTSRILATDYNSLGVNSNHTGKSSCDSLIPFLSFLLRHLRLSSPELTHFCFDYSSVLRLLYFYFTSVLQNTFYNHTARTPGKTPSSIVKNACLLVRYLAIVVLLLSVFVAVMCLPTRCLAMDIHVTIFTIVTRTNLIHRGCMFPINYLE